MKIPGTTDPSTSKKQEQSFFGTEASTCVPTEASICESETDSDWSGDEIVSTIVTEESVTVPAVGFEEGHACPVRRRLTGKTPVNDDRDDGGVPVHKKKPKRKTKPGVSSLRKSGKPQGDPDAAIDPRPEPLVDGPKQKDKAAPAAKSKKSKEPKGTGPTVSTTLEKIHAKFELNIRFDNF